MWDFLSRVCAWLARHHIRRSKVWVARKEYCEGEITREELRRRT
jgi:hypothetical protein